jgi:hypothetical protein
MYNKGASFTISESTFSTNQSLNGAGMYNDNVTASQLTDVTFSDNQATSGGGGMFNLSSSLTITDSDFLGNHAIHGSGMANSASSPIISMTAYINNHAPDGEETAGGGMYNTSSSNPEMTDITFQNNTAYSGGGMKNDNNSSPTLQNVSFLGNEAAWDGGGLANDLNSSPILTNVSFNGNKAPYGGGIANFNDSEPVIKHGTLAVNKAYIEGGGIFNSSSHPQIYNTVVWNNTVPTGVQIYDDLSGSSTVSDSVIEGGYPGGTNIITANPLLGSLGDFGGFTLVLPIRQGSSAIDAANPAYCPASDQRGITRPVDGNGDGLAVCDIGAFEFTVFQAILFYMPLIVKH